ncbi:MAG: glycerophosphodiester phosphodiesterase [Desulfobulbaceae bacterium]
MDYKILIIKSGGWLFLLLTIMACFAQAGEKVVIAHRAASGYLMEHNLPSVTLAVAMGSDYIEQDLVMTKDDQVIVLHDPTLERVTNVAQIFPGRAREDGKFYALDFTLAEIKQLQLREPYSNSGNGEGRFPDNNKNLKLSVPTLKEELELIRGLEKTMRRDIGIYPEIKQPWLHRKEGKDISKAVLEILREYGYKSKDDKIFLQCFDPEELKRIHDELFPALQMKLKLVQLIDDNNGRETKFLEWGEWLNYNYDWLSSKSGLRSLSAYITGIGMDKSMLVNDGGNLLLPELVSDAHSLGMVVHPYTFRREKESLPPYAATFEALLEFFYFKVGVDGLFTDYCGDAVLFLEKRVSAPVAEPAPEPAADGAGSEALPAQPAVAPEAPQPPVAPPPGTPGVNPVTAPEAVDAPAAPAAEQPAQAPSPNPVSVSGPQIVPIPAPVPVPDRTQPASPASAPSENKYR